MLGFLPLVTEIGKSEPSNGNGRSEWDVRFLTRLNNIYTATKHDHRSTNKQYCLLQGCEFEVPNGQLGWYPKMVFRFVDQLEAMLTHSRCVMIIRADLHINGYTDKNKVLAMFWRRLGKRLKRKYASLEIGYIWVREQEKAKQQHYHVMLMVSKELIHYSGTVTSMIIDVWKGITGTQAHIPKNCYYTVKRDDRASFIEPVKRVCYLAKSRGKGYRPPQTKDFGSSKIKRLN